MAKRVSDRTHLIVCVDTLKLRPNKFKHFGAELEAGVLLADKSWDYYEGNIKAIIIDAAVNGSDISEDRVDAAVAVLRADALDFAKSVAKCEVHPADWDLGLRSIEVLSNRLWLRPALVWHGGTLAGGTAKKCKDSA